MSNQKRCAARASRADNHAIGRPSTVYHALVPITTTRGATLARSGNQTNRTTATPKIRTKQTATSRPTHASRATTLCVTTFAFGAFATIPPNCQTPAASCTARYGIRAATTHQTRATTVANEGVRARQNQTTNSRTTITTTTTSTL